MKMIEVYVDGATFPNPGKGGWAWTTLQESDSGSEEFTTNNRMELMAPIQAIQSLYIPGLPLMIYSDSQYVVKGITEWIPGWIERGWKTKQGDVKNSDLWQELHSLVDGSSIFFKWVRGHSGVPGNEEADRLATLASGADLALIKKCDQMWKKIR